MPAARPPLMEEADRARAVAFLRTQPGFDQAKLADLERFASQCQLRRLPAGVDVVRQADYGDTLFLVLAGSMVVRLARPGGGETVLAILRRGEMFGELSVLGERPRSSTVTTNGPVEVLEAGREPLGKLLQSTPALLARLDRLYRHRAIASNVFADPLFADLTPEALGDLVDAARLTGYDKDEVVIAQGEEADAFYIVWSGHLRVSASIDGRDRIFTYLQSGDYFGETGLVEGLPRTATVTANEPSQVLEIRRSDFERCVASDPLTLERIRAKVSDRLAQMRSIKARPDLLLFIEDMLKQGATHATSALFINLDTCVRCGNCAAACHDRYGNSRLVRRGKDFVLPDSQARVLMPNSCWHCRDPECMLGCPTDALRRQPTGEISILNDRCIGCEICANQCPWGNITMAPIGTGSGRGPLARLFGAVRDAYRALRPAGGEPDDARYKAKAVKCDLCRGYPGGEPACVAACPYGAIAVVDPNAYLQRALDTGDRRTEVPVESDH